MKDKFWIKEKYNEIKRNKTQSYVFINMKIKRLRIINFLNGKAYGDELIQAAHDAVARCLKEDEYIAKVSSCSFDILLKVVAGEDDNDLLRRFNDIDECIEKERDSKFKSVSFCGFGLFYLDEYDVDFETAEYYAEVSRSQSPESPHMISHLNIYGHDFIDHNLSFLSLKKDFDEAMEKGYIQFYLQPKVNLKTGEILHAEALLRWIDPKRGNIPLSEFLPDLEEHGLVTLIDKLAFDTACKYTSKWNDRYHKKIKISTNISRNTFNYWVFLDEYREIYEKYQGPKECLELELLESIVLNQVDRVKSVVTDIKEFGITCALDDFGSGYSSFSVLTDSYLDILKIDRSLFIDFQNEREKYAVQHIVEFGHQLGMCIVAEGIEDKRYIPFLQSLDCDYTQGYVFYKPMPIEEFEERFVIGSERIVFEN